jgi:hypothetical protein
MIGTLSLQTHLPYTKITLTICATPVGCSANLLISGAEPSGTNKSLVLLHGADTGRLIAQAVKGEASKHAFRPRIHASALQRSRDQSHGLARMPQPSIGDCNANDQEEGGQAPPVTAAGWLLQLHWTPVLVLSILI